MLSIASVKAKNATIVFQSQTLRTQPYHKAEKQTELSTMATSTCLIISQEGFQQEHWKRVSQKHFPSLFHSNANNQEDNSEGTDT